MFTGIIEEVGRIIAIRRGQKAITLVIGAHKITSDMKLGDSIAVNGVCLTVTKFNGQQFQADIMAETLHKTSFEKLVIGDQVNLERAMSMNDRFGGHIVTGHVDATGTIVKREKDGIADWFQIRAPKEIMKLIFTKGSIAIDGISLTVAKKEKETFSVSVIPHTKSETTLSDKQPGSIVNLENDYVAKCIVQTMWNQGIVKEE